MKIFKDIHFFGGRRFRSNKSYCYYYLKVFYLFQKREKRKLYEYGNIVRLLWQLGVNNDENVKIILKSLKNQKVWSEAVQKKVAKTVVFMIESKNFNDQISLLVHALEHYRYQ